MHSHVLVISFRISHFDDKASQKNHGHPEAKYVDPRKGLALTAAESSFSHVPEGSAGLPPILDLTIDLVQEGLISGTFTSVDLVKAYIARIAEASEFNAILQVNPDAVVVAQQLDEERTRTGSRGYEGLLQSLFSLLILQAHCTVYRS